MFLAKDRTEQINQILELLRDAETRLKKIQIELNREEVRNNHG
jgi:hypothetical protein